MAQAKVICSNAPSCHLKDCPHFYPHIKSPACIKLRCASVRVGVKCLNILSWKK